MGEARKIARTFPESVLKALRNGSTLDKLTCDSAGVVCLQAASRPATITAARVALRRERITSASDIVRNRLCPHERRTELAQGGGDRPARTTDVGQSCNAALSRQAETYCVSASFICRRSEEMHGLDWSSR